MKYWANNLGAVLLIIIGASVLPIIAEGSAAVGGIAEVFPVVFTLWLIAYGALRAALVITESQKSDRKAQEAKE